MKNAMIGDYLLWNGKPARVVAESDKRMVIVELLENCRCPHCNGDLGKEQIHVIVSSPMFQQNADKIPSIVSDPTIIVT